MKQWRKIWQTWFHQQACLQRTQDVLRTRKKTSDTSASLLQYYSEIPLEWIDNLGWMFRAVFEMFGCGFPEPLESVYEKREHSRAQALPGKRKCGDLSMRCLSL